MAGYTRDVKKILRGNECVFVRQGKGDHEIWHSPHTDKNFPVDDDIKSCHTANGVLAQAGLKKAF